VATLPSSAARLFGRLTGTLDRGAVPQPRIDPPAAPNERAESLDTRRDHLTVIDALVVAMESTDEFLRGHSQRVSELAVAIARELGLEPDVTEDIRLAGRVHDVGKIGIRESVLLKPGPLSADEYEHIKTHVRIGVQILQPLSEMGAVLDYVRHHHERFDGTGYPQGLRGEEISLGGRVLAAADVFDALTSKRPYREPLSRCDALVLLAGPEGRLLDPRVFDALCHAVGCPSYACGMTENVG
jgi:putative nucleotidyltransferase with HDIG domain